MYLLSFHYFLARMKIFYYNIFIVILIYTDSDVLDDIEEYLKEKNVKVINTEWKKSAEHS